jgi:hypothetical protein
VAADDTDTSGDTGAPDPKTARKKQLKNEHILIGVGVLTLLVMYYFMRKSAANAASSTTASTTTSPYGTASTGYDSGYGGGGYNGYAGDMSGMAEELAQVQQELTGLTSPGSTNVTPPPVSPTTTGPSFSPITGTNSSGAGVASIVQNDLNSGIPVFYSDTTGATPQQVTQPGGPNTGWLVGGQPIGSQPNASSAPGSPASFFTAAP